MCHSVAGKTFLFDFEFLWYFESSRIAENLHEYIPNLHTVIMTGNNIQELGDLEPLTHLPHLETLCLLMNPVSTKPNYREYVAFKWVLPVRSSTKHSRTNFFSFRRFPNLRLLDFRKIKMAHRKEANDLFKSKKGKELLKEIAKRTKTGPVGSALEANGTNGKRRFSFATFALCESYALIIFHIESGATPAEVAKIREAIKTANSLQEVERLTRILQAGGPITDEMLNGNGENGKRSN